MEIFPSDAYKQAYIRVTATDKGGYKIEAP